MLKNNQPIKRYSENFILKLLDELRSGSKYNKRETSLF